MPLEAVHQSPPMREQLRRLHALAKDARPELPLLAAQIALAEAGAVFAPVVEQAHAVAASLREVLDDRPARRLEPVVAHDRIEPPDALFGTVHDEHPLGAVSQ